MLKTRGMVKGRGMMKGWWRECRWSMSASCCHWAMLPCFHLCACHHHLFIVIVCCILAASSLLSCVVSWSHHRSMSAPPCHHLHRCCCYLVFVILAYPGHVVLACPGHVILVLWPPCLVSFSPQLSSSLSHVVGLLSCCVWARWVGMNGGGTHQGASSSLVSICRCWPSFVSGGVVCVHFWVFFIIWGCAGGCCGSWHGVATLLLVVPLLVVCRGCRQLMVAVRRTLPCPTYSRWTLHWSPGDFLESTWSPVAFFLAGEHSQIGMHNPPGFHLESTCQIAEWITIHQEARRSLS